MRVWRPEDRARAEIVREARPQAARTQAATVPEAHCPAARTPAGRHRAARRRVAQAAPAARQEVRPDRTTRAAQAGSDLPATLRLAARIRASCAASASTRMPTSPG